ncbi:MAG TPA: hypothetical protein VN643_08620 [Pyrinomonadaceae bacterium]|nr:hypothetical protein [Pyrinomonadaceae bacterium]
MTEDLKPTQLEKVLLATRESMAVKRELAQLLTAQISDRADAVTYEADLGTFPKGSKLHFSLSDVLAETVLHFDDLNVTARPGDPPVRLTVPIVNSGENAITLVASANDANQWQAKFVVEADGVGEIINHQGGTNDDHGARKRVFVWRFRSVAQKSMVRWYEPGLLLRAQTEAIVSTLFGGHSDYRLIEALAVGKDEPYDCAGYYLEDKDGQYLRDEQDNYLPDKSKPPREEIWFDYVADTGDGWNPTYAVAYHVAQPELVLNNPDGTGSHLTKRGSVLVFGGDQVYPTASRKEYKERLVEPFRTALRYSEAPHPDVFAIPGNHDWYDSLVAFTRLFCSRRWFNGWRAPQKRSYFALRLPQKWWLLGIDIQLRSDLDHAQVAYFQHVAKQMQEGDRVILCTAEPHWLQTKVSEKYGTEYNESNLAFLENNILGRRVSLFLSGDLHYYRRHEAADGTQKLVAGGGGAFLAPTHGEDVDELRGGFKLKSSFPDEKTSRLLTWRNIYFPFTNGPFGFLPAILYFLTSWAVMADVGHFGPHDIDKAISLTVRTGIVEAGAVFWILFILITFVFFTNTKSKMYMWVAGLLHGWLHLLAIFFLGWGATYFTVSVLGLDFQSPLQLLTAAVIIFCGGWFIGSLLVGIFLIVSLNVFRCLHNSAFSSLRIEDWKNFLRIKIDKDGTLTVYPIGIRRVPRRWKRRPVGSRGPELIPDDSQATVPELIEPPIKLTVLS